MFAVPSDAAQAVIAYSGLEVASPLPGRAVCSLAFVRYADGDLGPYHEFAVAFLVKGTAGARGRVGAFVHWLPVNQAFTLEAGRTIWGFPKEMADIRMDLASRTRRCLVRVDGRTALEMHVRPGVPVPSRRAAAGVDAFTHMDGTTRRTPWTVSASGVRARPGGAYLHLGDHPVAHELRALGLDRARALSCATVDRVRMTFQDAVEVRT
ncbi:acetoacetate decarboxylase [Actinomadura logoneensis]|uniref:Acetoacetate decarboxylase n=2 Tax=Actinomadura logoneensis TaxID=2293572 RepID=A0A372JSE2_9ACTN|nr:acetoacetate decarboxylase [Actinomadura logoneensis]